MKLYVTQHDAERTWPALDTQAINGEGGSRPLLPRTQKLRLHADSDCLIAIGEQIDPDDLAWTRLAADVTEWFDVTKDSRAVRVWLKAEPEE